MKKFLIDMKILINIIIAVAMLLVNDTVIAQHYIARFPALIDSTGTMRDSAGVTCAFITKDNVIKNQAGQKIAFIDHDANLINDEGKVIGKIARNGSFLNQNGEVEFKVKRFKEKAYCEVYDVSGRRVLTGHLKYTGQASSMAYIHKQLCTSQ